MVNLDTDSDGVLDWEEGLWGTNPTKKETTEGVSDVDVINKIKAEQGNSLKITAENGQAEKLTKTDQFSRELFSTLATLNQNGVVTQETIDELSSSLVEKIKNPATRKVFLISDLKISNDNSSQAFTNYNNALNNIYLKNQVSYTALDVLQKFMIDEDNVDMKILAELNPIIEKTKKIIEGMAGTSVPQSISTLHLNVINSLQRLVENISDMQLFETDVIVALSGMSQYETNAASLESAVRNLGEAVSVKLNN